MIRQRQSVDILENQALASYTTLGVGGSARFLIEAVDESQVFAGMDFALSKGLPVFILGGGSNILASDAGFPGLVIRVALRGIVSKPELGPGVVDVGAGENWDRFVSWAVERDLAGIECLSGIPGTAGGTPVQNVGAYGQEVGEVISSVRVIDRESFSIRELGAAECRFSYRASLFNTIGRDRYIVLAIRFRLLPRGDPRIEYADLKRFFFRLTKCPSLAETREAVLRIRASKGMLLEPDCPDSRSAGSFFKNPVVTGKAAAEIEETARGRGHLHPSDAIPVFRAPGDMVKLSAAWLIENSGFHKGYAHGRAGLSSKHVLALVNLGGATAAEIMELASVVRAGVKERFGVELCLEPVLVGW